MVTNGVNRFNISNVGDIVIGVGAGTNSLIVSKNITGTGTSAGIRSSGEIQSGVVEAILVRAVFNQANFALTTFIGYDSAVSIINGTGTTLINFRANGNNAGYTNVYGFQSTIASGTGRYGIFSSGTAQNHFRGNVGIGSGKTVPAVELDVAGTIATTNFRITNGAAVGKVWQCNNVNGAGEWVTPLASERYIGEWAANSGVAPSASPTTGDYYVVNTAGTYLGISYVAGDEIYWNGTAWLKRSNFLTLPIATASILGGIKIGTGLTIDGSGIVSVANLATARTISATGDGTWSVSFNGSDDVSGVLTLANVVTAGTYSSVTVNDKGLVTAGTNPTTLAGLISVTSTGFTGELTGNASTATTLQTARTINGTSFNGSENITIPNLVSGSSQIFAGSTTNFATDVKTRLNAETVVSGSKVITIGSTGITLGGTATTIAGLTTITTSSDITVNGQKIGKGGGNQTGNTVFGADAGASNTTGTPNSFFGTRSGHLNTTGNYNAFFGYEAGQDVLSGNSNTIIGSIAGGETGLSNTIIIAAGTTERIRVNSVGVMSVAGPATFTGDVTANTSDKRLKDNIRVIDNPLEKLSKINGVYFNWNDTAKDLIHKSDDIEEVGFLAQEVQSVLPHIIKPAPFDVDALTGESKSGENYLTIQYEKIVPLLVEAIKELKKQVDELKSK